ncbi:Wall-associated receptor kinase, galacturonan-binding domain [Dillenia turbinata]|uniref:non-specific serine/threonine protein kinase n=1 Tax=Dillenia turbinata TaxID=194707 RepID=A0AAN8VDL7_9MAGN
MKAFELDCQGNVPIITISSVKYRVLEINNQTQTLKFARANCWDSVCPTTYVNNSLDFSYFSYEDCSTPGNYVNVFYGFITAIPVDQQVLTCKHSVSVPISESATQNLEKNATNVDAALHEGLVIEWNNNQCRGCTASGMTIVLDKFIYDKGSSETNCNLHWETLHRIAIGIARGLAYLHQGYENPCPKISDFGLAKLCNKAESKISIDGATGTVGYIAPEVALRSFGAVSHKSDVYTYGMMVLEMVGGRKNHHVEVSRTSEIYFPQIIYKCLDSRENSRLVGIENGKDEEISKKMILVNLWCIQINPADRPSMKSQLVRVARKDLLDGICLQKFVNTTLDYMLFDYGFGYGNVSLLYGCPSPYVQVPSQFTCLINGVSYSDGYVLAGAVGPGVCYASVVIPVAAAYLPKLEITSVLDKAIDEGFVLKWKVDSGACSECSQSNGRCGYDLELNQTTCLCPGRSVGSKTCTASPAEDGVILQPSPAAPVDRTSVGYQSLSFNVKITSLLSSLKYRLLAINLQAETLTVARDDYWNSICPTSFVNTTLNNSYFNYVPGLQNLTFYYNCSSYINLKLTLLGQTNCITDGSSINAFYNMLNTEIDSRLWSCKYTVYVSITDSGAQVIQRNPNDVGAALQEGFGIQWSVDDNQCHICNSAGGQCGYNASNENHFICYCYDQPYNLSCLTKPPASNLPSFLYADDLGYVNCSKSFDCGSINGIKYPFWGQNRPDYCGMKAFELGCQGNVSIITMSSVKYRVLEIYDQSQSLKIARADYWDSICPTTYVNTSLDFSYFSYASGYQNLTFFYECDINAKYPLPAFWAQENCSTPGNVFYGFITSIPVDQQPLTCNYSVYVPISESAAQKNVTNVEAALHEGFVIEWNNAYDNQCRGCSASGGWCGYNSSTDKFTCYCKDKPYDSTCGNVPSPLPPSSPAAFGLLACFKLVVVVANRHHLCLVSYNPTLYGD